MPTYIFIDDTGSPGSDSPSSRSEGEETQDSACSMIKVDVPC